MQENFRSQAFGFNKKDVVDYIFNLNNEKEKLEMESSAEIKELSAENERLTSENLTLASEKERLEEEVQKLRAEVADADIHKSRLFEEINETRRMLLDNEREFNIKNEQISKLIAENEDYAEKCEKYAEISRDVGKTIMEAKQMAMDIVERAKKEAEEIRKATEKSAAETLRELSGANTELETLKRNLADMTRVCENRIKTVEINLASMSDSVSAFVKTETDTDDKNGEDDKPQGETPNFF